MKLLVAVALSQNAHEWETGEPVLEAAIADDTQDRVATDGGELVARSDEGAVLETDDIVEETLSVELDIEY